MKNFGRLVAGFAVFLHFASSEATAFTCQALFEAKTALVQKHPSSLLESLPPELQTKFQQLKPKVIERFENRFSKRDRIRAETETIRLITVLLKDFEATSLKLVPLISPTRRSDAISDLIKARHNHEQKKIDLENLLIEIGYSRGSETSQRWRTFRDQHKIGLERAKRIAVNSASSFFMGLPLDVRAYPYSRRYLNVDDPVLRREIKIEIAFDIARRIAAIAILAILTDEFLDFTFPSWKITKAGFFGQIEIADRKEMEEQALNRWKDVVEAFTNERPGDNSPDTLEIIRLIRAASDETLWLHLHEGAPLVDRSDVPVIVVPSSPSYDLWNEADQKRIEREFGL